MPSTDRSRWFVSTEWLADHLSAPDVVVVDASWYMPASGRDPHREYLGAHIPGAVFFDLDGISDHSSSLPHMLPSPEQFASAMRKLGIGDGMRIVVYDGPGLFSAPRVWWTFKVMGARDVVLLEGGLTKWRREGRPLEDGEVRRGPRHFTARIDHALVRDLEDVRAAGQSGSALIVDARAGDRFRGEVPEPRAGLRSGHMPGSVNVSHADIVEDGQLIDTDRLRAAFEGAGVTTDKPVITSCGSGVSAAILWLALETLGHTRLGLYDGSWTEWGGRDDTTVLTGPA